MSKEHRGYSSEEVSAIVRRGLELDRASGGGNLTQADLEDVARQSGVSPEALREAIAERAELARLEQEIAAGLQKRRRAFYEHLRTFAIVNGSLLAVALFLGSAKFGWLAWMIGAWGMALAFDAWDTFMPSQRKLEQSARRRLARQERRAMKSRSRRRDAEAKLEEAAESGH